jgi:hypothetical protein
MVINIGVFNYYTLSSKINLSLAILFKKANQSIAIQI